MKLSRRDQYKDDQSLAAMLSCWANRSNSVKAVYINSEQRTAKYNKKSSSYTFVDVFHVYVIE